MRTSGAPREGVVRRRMLAALCFGAAAFAAGAWRRCEAATAPGAEFAAERGVAARAVADALAADAAGDSFAATFAAPDSGRASPDATAARGTASAVVESLATVVASGAALDSVVVWTMRLGADLCDADRRVLGELLAAAQELDAGGDREAARLVVEDALAFLRQRSP